VPPIVSIQFNPVGKQYHFDAQGITDLEPGDRVVVQTSRGKQLGIVVNYTPEEELKGRICKPIERRATPRDLVMLEQWKSRELNALVTCREKAEELGIKGYKFIKAEYNYDGSQITILFTTDKRRAEQSDLQRQLRRILRTKVEFFQIGPRDLAKELDGLGACGVQRCCSRFLTRFDSVSIRMAKVQQISLTPTEVTGLCGRLRCCLGYEHEQYVEAAQGLPKRGKDIDTPFGRGKVVEIRTLAGVVVVEVEGVRHVVEREDIGKTEFTNPPPKREMSLPQWMPEEDTPDKKVERGRRTPPSSHRRRQKPAGEESSQKPVRSRRSTRSQRDRRSRPKRSKERKR
jgi:cell fate regulator YaaT (PSP1 superfamily)